MEKKLETRMMTDKVMPREVKEKQDEGEYSISESLRSYLL